MKFSTTVPRPLPTTFDGLARVMVPHAILDDADYDNTVELASRLAVLAEPTKGQRQYLDTLAQLIHAYDEEHNVIDTSDIKPLDLLKSLLADHNMTASDLGRLLGSRELGSKILRGERSLSKANVKALAVHFKLSSAAFLA